MTSDGSSRCQLANVCFELAPTVTEKTVSCGSLVPRSARNISLVEELCQYMRQKIGRVD